jgi:N12 class adenine-specific DNA methylase
MQREKERREQGLPSLIGIQYGMRGARIDEPLPKINAETGIDDLESRKEPAKDADDAETDRESEKRGELRRQKIIARVEALRSKQRMTKQEFHSRIGVSEARSWRAFVNSAASEAWKHVTPQMFEKIAHLFGIDSAGLLQ